MKLRSQLLRNLVPHEGICFSTSGPDERKQDRDKREKATEDAANGAPVLKSGRHGIEDGGGRGSAGRRGS